MARINEESARKLSKRTQNVWVAFFVTIASAMFVLQISSKPNKTGLMAMLVSIEERPTEDPLFSSIEKAHGLAWSSIVIHHSGQPAGTVEEIHRNHQNSGLGGAGYHFVIGNGLGSEDGRIYMQAGWDQDPALWNSGVINICISGDGNKREFTVDQLVQLYRLVQRLQLGLSIPLEKVLLANEIDNGSQSPGRYFAEAQLRSQLLDIPVSN